MGALGDSPPAIQGSMPGQKESSPSLDINSHNYAAQRRTPEERKRGRLWHQLQSGIARHKGERLRFLTLTSSTDEDVLPLGKAWQRLKDRITRLTPAKLLKGGYIHANDIRKYYGGQLLKPLSINYLKVETREGNGVLHVLYYGDYIPQQWLSNHWQDLRGAYQVDIRSSSPSRAGGSRGLASYILRQYVADQDALVRYSCGMRWVFRGSRRLFHAIIKHEGFTSGVLTWQRLMEKQWSPPGPDAWVDTRGSWMKPPKPRCRSWSGIDGGGWAITIDTHGVDLDEARRLLGDKALYGRGVKVNICQNMTV